MLELIVKRGRALVDARTVLIMLREGDELVVAASAGHASDARGRRVPIADSTSGRVLERGRPSGSPTSSPSCGSAPAELGVPDAHLCASRPDAPPRHRARRARRVRPGRERGPFSAEDEQLLRTFAASAAQAVALNRSVEADRLRSTIAAADAERSRWARELHDQTLQSLGGLRVALASVLGRGDRGHRRTRAIRQAIEDIELEIANLRAIITDLRPSMLDDLGLLPAIEALLERRRDAGAGDRRRAGPRASPPATRGLDPELETTIYRLVQEALTNVIKHAQASTVRVSVAAIEGEVRIEVQDDGLGFDPAIRSEGFGLAGMRERVYLAGGTVELQSGENGTLVRARLPLQAENAASEVGAAAS